MKYPAVLAEICATLANLACHKANSQFLVDNGGCDLIIKAMRLYPEQVDLQIQAFHAIAGVGRVSRMVLEREKFIELAMRSLKIHHNSVELVSCNLH